MIRRLDVARADRANRLQLPLVLAADELRAQERRFEDAEQIPRERVVVRIAAAAEIDVQRELVGLIGFSVRWSSSSRSSDNSRATPGERRSWIVDETRHRVVAARCREQRHVVARALVFVGPAQVEDARRAILEILRIRQIRARRHNRHAGNRQLPVLRVVDDEQQVQVSSAPLRGVINRILASEVRLPSSTDEINRLMLTQ